MGGHDGGNGPISFVPRLMKFDREVMRKSSSMSNALSLDLDPRSRSNVEGCLAMLVHAGQAQ